MNMEKSDKYNNSNNEDEEAPSVIIPPNADESNNENPKSETEATSDAIAKGISSLLVTVIKDFDSTAQYALDSQDQVSSSISRLTEELDRLLEDAPLLFMMQHAARISSVRKRVSSLNSVLKSIQRRVDNIDHMLSASSSQSHEKPTAEAAGK